MDMTTKVKVFNVTNGWVGYTNENYKTRRIWQTPGSFVIIPLEEIQDTLFTPGGEKLYNECLLVKESEARELLGLSIDDNYLLDDTAIDALLKNGTNEELEDILERAPRATKERIFQRAVDLRIDSVGKLEIIRAVLGYDIISAIKEAKETEEKKPTPKTAPVNKIAKSPVSKK